MICIYKIVSPTKKIYVGQTWNWIKREYNYTNLECKNQKKLYSSLKKHGFKNHKFEILIQFNDKISQESLNFYEVYWWKFYKDLGFNMLNVKEPGSYGKHSEETKRKMRGNIISQETRTKISNSLKGRKLPKEVCAKISNSNKGRKMSDKTKKALLEYNKLPKKPESIEKMRKALIGRKLTPEHIQKYKNRFIRPIYMLDLEGNIVKEFNSLKEASLFLGLSQSNSIWEILSKKGKRKTIKKLYTFIDKEDFKN